MLYFVCQKMFGTFPVFHLIIQLLKLQHTITLQNSLRVSLAYIKRTVGDTALFASIPACHGASLLGGYHFT